MIDIESIGSRVKYHRLRNKISQEELAELAQVSRVHISYLERGERIPSMESFINIANALNVSADELLANNLLVTGSNMVDNKKIAFNPAVELSFLTAEEQTNLLDAMECGQSTPSLSQAQRLKKLSQDGGCDRMAMYAMMSEEKKSELGKVTIDGNDLRKFFPKSYTPKQMHDVIIKLLTQWQKKRQRDQER